MSGPRIVVLTVGAVLVGILAFWLTTRTATDETATLESLASVAREAPESPAIVDSAVRDPAERPVPAALSIEVLETLPHDSTAFTQGFELLDDRLFESTGLVDRSTLRELDSATGAVVRSLPVPDVFAEGLTIVDDEILQLTWRDGVAFRYDVETFELVDTHRYEGEGWGLCLDEDRLVMSDGSSTLRFRDKASFEVVGEVNVTFSGAPVPRINELECVDGQVWANIWLTSLIVEIDLDTGQVASVLDAADLRPQSTFDDDSAVLNGIAYDSATDTFLVTGKRWPVTYRVKLS